MPCKGTALPSELHPPVLWAREDSNFRPHAYQACALTDLSYGPLAVRQHDSGKNLQPVLRLLPRKEVIQPQLPLQLPCYDFVPVTSPAPGGSSPIRVGLPTSGMTSFHDVTGGVYKARERIHRRVLTGGY